MKYIFIVLMTLLSSCQEQETNNQDLSIALDKNHIDSFQSFVSNFVWNRHKFYNSEYDLFLIEDKFSYDLKNSFDTISDYPLTVFSNSYDSLRKRREMILLDTNMHTFFAITPNLFDFTKIKMNTDITGYGRLLGYRMTEDTANPDLEQPEFFIYLDSICLLSTHNLFK